MATTYKKVNIKSYPRVAEKITRDNDYWKNFEFPIRSKEYGAITSIDFSPAQPYYYAVTNSSRVQIYNPISSNLERTISRFKETAYSAVFRDDGQLLTAGGDEGLVKLFDASSKSLLRVFKGHSGPVHVTRFMSDSLHIFSGSDDKTVKIWDIPTEKVVVSYTEHQDYVRCGASSRASTDIMVSGGYDHMVKLFDKRVEGSILTVDHGSPVESVLMFPSGGIFISAGGNCIKLWDALAGGKLLAQLNNHHKTVTCLQFSGNYQRLLAGSLDRHVKIYDVKSYQVVHTLDYPGPILSLGIAGDDSVLVVGMSDGLLSIQQRKKKKIEDKSSSKKKRKGKFMGLRTVYFKKDAADFVPKVNRDTPQEPHDKFMRKFEYSRALDSVFYFNVRRRCPEVTYSVLQELVRRGRIKSVLAGRDDRSIENIVKFIQKNISNPKYMSTLTDIANLLLDMYGVDIEKSAAVDAMFLRLKYTVKTETDYMKMLAQTMGAMETIFSASSNITCQKPKLLNTDTKMFPVSSLD